MTKITPWVNTKTLFGFKFFRNCSKQIILIVITTTYHGFAACIELRIDISTNYGKG